MSNPSSPAIESILPVPVLVVEDEPLLQQRLCAVLMQLGYAQDALLMAASLAEARACLAVQPVALRLMDDAVSEPNAREAYLANAPAAERGLFLVPRVIE